MHKNCLSYRRRHLHDQQSNPPNESNQQRNKPKVIERSVQRQQQGWPEEEKAKPEPKSENSSSEASRFRESAVSKEAGGVNK